MKIFLPATAAMLAIATIPQTGSAQWISLGLRGSGGVPTGSFAEDQNSSSDAVVTAAKIGFGYGLEAGAGIGRTFTVRKVSFGVGVERTFPLHSPIFEQIEIVTRGDVRRAKLYYLRNLRGKAAKIKERRES